MKKFSGLMFVYVEENKRRFKSVINKREIIHKILKKILGLLNTLKTNTDDSHSQ